MAKFLQHVGGAISVAPDFSGSTIDFPKKGYYRIACSQSLGFHLLPIEELQVPDKVYGSLLKYNDRIMEVFQQRQDLPTTVMLEGLKGSGKSLMMKKLANDFVNNHDGIVLLCTSPFTGDGFFEFLQAFKQPKMVLMDEFDKVYSDKGDLDNILTLLDGTYASHTLFVLTMNASSASSKFEFFHNRPGRVFFNIKFKSVDLEAVQLYLEDCLDNKSRIPEVMMFVKRFRNFNMDMLGTLVREINDTKNVDINDIAVYLNIKPDLSLDDMFFDYRVKIDGLEISDYVSRDYLSSARIRQFLNSMQKGNFKDAGLYIDSNRHGYWNLTKNTIWDDKEHSTETDEKEYSVVISHKGKPVGALATFSFNVSGEEAAMKQDPESGVVTLTQKVLLDQLGEDTPNKECIVEVLLIPELIRHTSFGF